MIVKIREGIFLCDKDVTLEEIKKNAITVVEFVAPAPVAWLDQVDKMEIEYFSVFLNHPKEGKINKPHIKDIACHIPKYMSQNGEIVAIIGETGLVRGAYVVARAICEIENRPIYEVFMEMQKLIKGFDIGKAYL